MNADTPAILLDCDIRSQEGILQSLGRKGVPLVAVSSKRDCPAFHSKYVTHTFISPDINADSDAYIQFLLDLPVKGVIIYSNDVSAVILSRHREALGAAGFSINLPESSTLEEVFDKWTCCSLAGNLEISFPKTRMVSNFADVEACWDEFEKPVILKGTRMAGGNYIKFSSLREAKDAWNVVKGRIDSRDYQSRCSELMLQEWLSYDMTDVWHCETVYNKQSEPMGHFTIRHIRTSFMDQGTYSSRLYAGEYVYSQELIDITDKLLSSVGWRGFANVDYVYLPDSGRFCLLEVNPRLPGFSYYPSQAGYEMAWYYYCDLVGLPVSTSDEHPPSLYFESLRYPGDISDGIKNMLRGFLKPGPFVRSYLRLFAPGTQKIIEPVKLDDLGYTLAVQRGNARDFVRNVAGFSSRRAKQLFRRFGGENPA